MKVTVAALALVALTSNAAAMAAGTHGAHDSAGTHGTAAVSHELPWSGADQLEGAVAVDENHPNRIAVLATDYVGYVLTVPGAGVQTRVGPVVRLFLSSDGGSQWRIQDVGGHLPDYPSASVSNPSLVWAGGRLFGTWLGNDGTAGAGSVEFATFDWSGRHSPVTTLSSQAVGPAMTADKPWVSATDDGRTVTVAWTLFATTPGEYPQVVERTSTDGGHSFAAPAVVSPVSAAGLVGSTGATLATPLYLRSRGLVTAWHQGGSPTGTGDSAVVLPAGSRAPVTAMAHIVASGSDGTYPRFANQPMLAEDAHHRLFLVAGVPGTHGVRAAITMSTDGGRHWGPVRLVAPVRGDVDQLNAAVAVAADGTIGVVYQQVAGRTLRTMLAVSTDGTTWTTVALSDRTTAAAPYTATSNGTAIGDFLTIVTDGRRFTTVYPQQDHTALRLRLTRLTSG